MNKLNQIEFILCSNFKYSVSEGFVKWPTDEKHYALQKQNNADMTQHYHEGQYIIVFVCCFFLIFK